jgi:hypothetical protein
MDLPRPKRGHDAPRRLRRRDRADDGVHRHRRARRHRARLEPLAPDDARSDHRRDYGPGLRARGCRPQRALLWRERRRRHRRHRRHPEDHQRRLELQRVESPLYRARVFPGGHLRHCALAQGVDVGDQRLQRRSRQSAAERARLRVHRHRAHGRPSRLSRFSRRRVDHQDGGSYRTHRHGDDDQRLDQRDRLQHKLHERHGGSVGQAHGRRFFCLGHRGLSHEHHEPYSRRQL